MSKKIKDTDYLVLTAVLRAREPKMLGSERTERMLSAASFDEAAKILVECGYPDMSEMDAAGVEKALEKHRIDIVTEIAKLSPDKSVADIFRMKYDYHNAKVIVKAEGANVDGESILSYGGRIDPLVLSEAYRQESFADVPAHLAGAMIAAKNILARTQNPQLADFELDREYFSELVDECEKIGSGFLSGYVRLLIDSANLRTYARTIRMGRDADFMRLALIAGGNVRPDSISVDPSGDTLGELFVFSPLYGAAQLARNAAGGESMTAFERECDNAIVSYLSSAKMRAFGEEPEIAFLAAVENETTAARMILTGRLSGIDPSILRERLRESYV